MIFKEQREETMKSRRGMSFLRVWRARSCDVGVMATKSLQRRSGEGSARSGFEI